MSWELLAINYLSQPSEKELQQQTMLNDDYLGLPKKKSKEQWEAIHNVNNTYWSEGYDLQKFNIPQMIVKRMMLRINKVRSGNLLAIKELKFYC